LVCHTVKDMMGRWKHKGAIQRIKKDFLLTSRCKTHVLSPDVLRKYAGGSTKEAVKDK